MTRLIKSVGNPIIDFLEQIENFQKMLWEKRKFVTETHYCIAVGRVDSKFYSAISTNEAQWTEWRQMFELDGLCSTSRDCSKSRGSAPEQPLAPRGTSAPQVKDAPKVSLAPKIRQTVLVNGWPVVGSRYQWAFTAFSTAPHRHLTRLKTGFLS